MMRRLTTTTLLSLVTISANATKYVRTFADVADLNKGLTLERTYNSNSLSNGSFGFGWCSDLDLRLEPTRDGRLKLRSCTTNNEAIFIAQTNPQTSPSPRAASPDRSPAFSPRVGGTFLSVEGDVVELKDGLYIQYKNGSPIRKFDQTGRLLEWTATNGVVHRVKRNVYGHPVFYQTSRGARLTIKTDESGRILTILVPGKGAITYQYHGQNLVFVRQPDGFEFNYIYDDLHNLLRTSSNEGFVETVTYDKLRDEVLSVHKDIVKEIQ